MEGAGAGAGVRVHFQVRRSVGHRHHQIWLTVAGKGFEGEILVFRGSTRHMGGARGDRCDFRMQAFDEVSQWSAAVEGTFVVQLFGWSSKCAPNQVITHLFHVFSLNSNEASVNWPLDVPKCLTHILRSSRDVVWIENCFKKLESNLCKPKALSACDFISWSMFMHQLK